MRRQLGKKVRDLRIAVDPNTLFEKRMSIGIIRKILTGIVLTSYGIRCKIQEQTDILAENIFNDW